MDMTTWIKDLFSRPVSSKDVGRVERGFRRKAAAYAKRLPVLREATLLFRFVKDSKVPLPAKAVGVLALLYFITPFDVAPDAIPVAGLLDDAAVILAAVSMLAPRLARYRDEPAEPEHVVPAEIVAAR